MHWKEPSPTAEERTVHSWSRSEGKESALDYPERYERADRDRTAAHANLEAPATDAQRALLEMLGVPDFPPDATWVDATLEIDQQFVEREGRRLEGWLRDMGVSEQAAHALIRRAVDDVGQATTPTCSGWSRPEPLVASSRRPSTPRSKHPSWSTRRRSPPEISPHDSPSRRGGATAGGDRASP